MFPDLLPLSAIKYANLQDLKQFCGPEGRIYFDSLPHE
jgi:hypothetical protein